MLKSKIVLCCCLAIVSPFLAAETTIQQQVTALWKQQDYAAAHALLTPQIDRKTKDAVLLALAGQTEALLNNPKAAENLLERAVKLDNSNADYQHWYASVSCNLAQQASMLSALGHARRCRSAYEKALELAPENPRSYIALGSYYAQAPGVAGGDKVAARALAAKLTELDALQGGLLYLKTVDVLDDAEFQQMLQLYPALELRPEPYVVKGIAQSAKQQYGAAIAFFQQAQQQPSADPAAIASQSTSRYQLGRAAVLGQMQAEQGITALQQYLAEDPEVSSIDWAKLRLAQLYRLQQDTIKADEILQSLRATTDNKLKDELKKLL